MGRAPIKWRRAVAMNGIEHGDVIIVDRDFVHCALLNLELLHVAVLRHEGALLLPFGTYLCIVPAHLRPLRPS
jgi:hypothetical protein